jgi:polyisoprenoid-binding protein YceI
MKSFLKYLLLVVVLFSVNTIQAQVISFHHGGVKFYTSSIMSDIDAISEDIDVKLNLQSGDVQITIPIESFEFEYELMQEHFVEEYMESEKFPSATFKGKIAQDLSGEFEAIEIDVSGNLTIHGVTKEIQFVANISKNTDYTIVKCKFPVVFKDFNVKEPAILSKSVAKDVEVKGNLYLK